MEYGLVLLWLIAYLGLLIAGLPLAARLFPRLADRGAGVAVPLSATILWLVGYWLGHLSLPAAGPVGVLTLLALAGAILYTSEIEFDRRIVAETTAVFTLAFLFMIAVRAVDPAVHPTGGEKFLDYGLLRSLLRSGQLPPEDMWFAGEPVSYYYGGHLLVSILTRLTGTDPKFAYNLALSGFYAMLVTAAYGLAGTLATRRGGPRRVGAILGAFFVGFASNLLTPGRFVLWLLPDGIASFVSSVLSIEMAGLLNGYSSFSYWDASRIIEGTINEFPLFAWLNGDLHAHMMSTPFLLLVAALLCSYYLTPAGAIARRRLLVLGTIPPMAGLLAVVNTWSFPTVGGLTLLTLWLSPTDPRTLLPATLTRRLPPARSWASAELARLLTAGAVTVVVVFLGLLWSGPFWFGTASSRQIALFPERSPLAGLLLVYGGFLLVFGSYLLRHGVGRVERRDRAAVLLVLLAGLAVLVDASAVALFAPLVGVGWALLRYADRPIEPDPDSSARVQRADGGHDADGATAVEEGSSGSDQSVPSRPGFETVLILAGAGLALLVEFAYVNEQAGPGRMNTVFKTYMQVWVLWGVAAGGALTHLLVHHRPGFGLSGGRWKRAFRVFAIVLVVSTSLYGVIALSHHFGSDADIARVDDPTLDATAFLDVRHPDEGAAIRWLDDTVAGQPTIVSAPGGYTWHPEDGQGSSAAASLTGIPTVVGWHHEVGYRGEEAFDRRAADVRTIYTGSSTERARLLAAYDVAYVYVGPAERAKYGTPTFEELAGVTPVEEASRWESVTIYRVDQQALDSGSD